MAGNQTFTAMLPELSSPPGQGEKEELDRLQEFERSVTNMTEMLRADYWDDSEKNGVAADLHAEITKLWMDMEGIGNELRRNQDDAAQPA